MRETNCFLSECVQPLFYGLIKVAQKTQSKSNSRDNLYYSKYNPARTIRSV